MDHFHVLLQHVDHDKMAPCTVVDPDDVPGTVLSQLDLYHPSRTEEEKTARGLIVRLLQEGFGDWYTDFLETVPFHGPLDRAISERVQFVMYFCREMSLG